MNLLNIRIAALVLAIALNTSVLHAQQPGMNTAVNRFQTLYNQQNWKDIFNMMSPRIQSLMPEATTMQMMTQLYNQAGAMQSYTFTKQEGQLNYYKTSFANTTLSLIAALEDGKLSAFRFVPYQEDAATKDATEVSLHTPTGNIYGSLTVPATKDKCPAVLLIAGSGPTDRDGNQQSIHTNAYKLVADSLKDAGIACLRYDKRGVGKSAAAMASEDSMTFDDMVHDAEGFITLLKNDRHFSSVTVLGHSEGSLVGMIAANAENADGFISLSGIGSKAGDVVVRQIAAQSEDLAAVARPMIDSITKGYAVHCTNPTLESLFRPSVQRYLQSWFRYDPTSAIKKLHIPVLIAQGSTDLQVAVSEARLLQSAIPGADLRIIDGMNHVLKSAPEERTQNMATYANPKLPLASGLMPTLITFIRKVDAGH